MLEFGWEEQAQVRANVRAMGNGTTLSNERDVAKRRGKKRKK